MKKEFKWMKKKTIDAYNNLLKILSIKNKQFEQNVFNHFWEDQNVRAKSKSQIKIFEHLSFDINKYNEVIKKSTNPEIKQKFNVFIDKINEANKPVKDNKPILKMKSYRSVAQDMYPKSLTFSMKITAARGMGKTIFLIALLHSFINRGIVNYEDINIFCPTFNEQNQWRSSSFLERTFIYLNQEYAKGKLSVFDDIQLDSKINKLIETLFIRRRHNKTGILQYEQFTQWTAHIKIANIDSFVLIPPFNESTAQYYHEKFMPTLTTKNIWKLGLLAEEKAIKEDNTELRYLITNKFGDISIGYKYRVCPFEDGNYAIV